MSDPIAFARPDVGEEEAEAAAAVVRTGWIVGGGRLAELEDAFAQYGGARHAVGTSSWTAGAFLVLHAWGIGSGDEVIVPSLTFIASVNVVRLTGAEPVFVDVDPKTWNIDPVDVDRRITPRTRAIIAIDQLGMPCNIDRINAIAARHGLRVLQDAACAVGARTHGRPIGALAEVTVFSLHARKVATSGEGGMILTDDAAFAERLRMLRHQGMSLSDFARHGARPTIFETYPEIGFNFRITDVQAAIGVVQMKKLDDMLARRRAVAEAYTAALADHPLVTPPHVPAGLSPNWQSYQVSLKRGEVTERNALMDFLHDRGVPTRRGVMASHREPPYRAIACDLPHTERASDTTLQLPMHSGLPNEHVARVLAALREANDAVLDGAGRTL